ncbi:hypothetical protein GCM10027169_16140 [Gordonia jinhuaensis]|uniref:DUF91 domain-containing protein n=1 Tax=Gordonia jinhuaensis TaxID=1517702 RepID=A0A916TJP9_9ACTN|nr:DUF91 domain-containing protein [Gordonia jinhuaensis]GGB48608.1 hypothetical protein GCM10011489_39670 [Gordonia jinhuaensis]
MHVSFGLWRLDGGVRQVSSSVIASEDRLEEILEARPDILGSGDLLRIGRQVVTDYGKRIDLLAMDAQGDLHVIELKKNKTPRDVVAQALEYGFWAQSLSFDAIRDLYAKHNGEADFESAFTDHFEVDVPDTINSAHHLVIVAAGMDTSTAQIVEYVRGYGVPINVLFFQYLRDDEREYLARSWLSNPDLESPTPGGSGAKKQAAWNGQDFYVAVGESRHRNWDDMRRYGFVSAGHGDKYRKAMLNLFEGARVWAAIPSIGYVGVGEVEATAVPVTAFDVEVEGTSIPILEVPLRTENISEDADDPAMTEYLVRVRWIDTRSRDRAVWEKGMYANQNVVTKLRHSHTLQQLAKAFDVDE